MSGAARAHLLLVTPFPAPNKQAGRVFVLFVLKRAYNSS